MKKFIPVFICLLVASSSFAQDSTASRKYIRHQALGFSLVFNDYLTAQRIRSTSLSSVLANDQQAKLKEKDAGIAIGYYKGLTENVDLATTLAGSFVKYTVGDAYPKDRLLLEADASLNLKLLSEKYWFTPYLSVGAGLSKYGIYYGAFIPVGGGLKINLMDEAQLFFNTQYRIPVITSTSNYHFMSAFGITGTIGK